ncbi:GNAT family N-acetyltransferase [Emcibacter sp. SYSU 3D8]|uniref:GNAT family N-acetyltransferase n=1 Tax=Emcibacter sp. SYSU 3D8 TaxID=3133969 RepID=UPI0031FED3CA
MLARLYDLPDLDEALARMAAIDIDVRPALVLERPSVLSWVTARFPGWAAEVDVAFARLPAACHIAVQNRQLLGFACYDAACRNYFGPMGVAEAARTQGVGRALLLSVLHAQRAQGYAYSIIGGVGPADFYAKAVGAVVIEGSERGVLEPLAAGRTLTNTGA